MLAVSGEEVESVREQGQHGQQGAFRATGASGKVEHEGAATDAADASAERGEGRVTEAVLAHFFGEAGDESMADGECCFGGDIAGSEACASGGDDQGCAFGGVTQSGLDLRLLVGQHGDVRNGCACCCEDCRDGGAGEICLRSCEAAVADGDDDCAATGEGGNAHPFSIAEP